LFLSLLSNAFAIFSNCSINKIPFTTAISTDSISQLQPGPNDIGGDLAGFSGAGVQINFIKTTPINSSCWAALGTLSPF
jgi:hypothetical protein